MYPIVELRKLSDLEREAVNLLLRETSGVSQAEIINGLQNGPSQPTVSRMLKGLVEKGIIVKSGATRGSRFALSDEARSFATDPNLRPPVHYDPSRIADYVPNETRWLDAGSATRMAAAAGQVTHNLDASTYSMGIAEHFMIDLSWASSNLEGNTYDYLSTEVLLKYGQEATGKQREETAMILNHKAAINHVLEHLGEGIPDARSVRRVHALMMRDLLEPTALGEIRSGPVKISSSCYRPASSQKDLSYDQQLLLSKAREISDPFEASFFLLAGTSYLQAFWDGNKRMGRLLSSTPLLSAGLPPHSFIGISKRDYTLGLIMFYETGDLELLGDVVATSYEHSAPTYEAAVTARRIPRSIELSERANIAEAVRSVIQDDLGLNDLHNLVATHFSHLSEEDRLVIEAVMQSNLEGITPNHSVLYNVDEDQIERWIETHLSSRVQARP